VFRGSKGPIVSEWTGQEGLSNECDDAAGKNRPRFFRFIGVVVIGTKVLKDHFPADDIGQVDVE